MFSLSGIRMNTDNISLRTAGVLFLLLGLINLFNEASQPVHVLVSTSGIAYIICLLIGTLLFLRIPDIVPFARFTVIAGFVLQGGYLILHGLFLDFMLQLILCGGLWLVLSPRSKEFRILQLSGILFVVLVLGVDMFVLVTRYDGAGSMKDNPTIGISAATVDTVYGNAYAYRLDFGESIWHERYRKTYLKSDPATDLWLVDPQKDAHLIVIGEHTPDGSNANLDAFAAAVKYNLLEKNPGAKLINISRLYGVYYDGILLKLKSDVDGVPLEYLVGLYTVKNYAFQVIGYTHVKAFSSFEPNFVDAIKSFYFDAKAQQKMNQIHGHNPIADDIH